MARFVLVLASLVLLPPLSACRPPATVPDAARRDGANDDEDAGTGDRDGGDDVDANVDAGPPEDPYFTEVAASIGLTAPHGVFQRPPDCLFDDPAMTGGPGDHCDAEWGLAGATVGDANGDGHDDLFVTRVDSAASLYLNDGAGHFTDETAARGLTIDEPTAAAAFGDIDRDGDQDLFVSVLGGLAHRLYINEGATFREAAVERGVALTSALPLLGSALTFGDYDLDGDLDLYVGEWRFRTIVHDGPSMARLFRNRGPAMPGYFEDVTTSAGVSMEDAWDGVALHGVYVYAVAMLDLDRDGNVDLAVNGDFHTSRLFWGRGDGTFQDGTVAAGVGTETNAMGSTFADLDGDGDLDWLVTSIWMDFGPDWGNRLWRNDGSRHFTDVAMTSGVMRTGWAWGTALFDYDNDSDADLAITNGWAFAPFENDAMALYRNDGAFAFRDVSARAGMTDVGQGRALVIFDPDEDGDQDVFIARYGDTPLFFRNERGTEQSWLRVRVTPRTAAPEGLGARVIVTPTAGGPTQTVVIGATTHYGGQSERIAHFGLGAHTGTIADVRVELPGGGTITQTDVAMNQVLELTEP